MSVSTLTTRTYLRWQRAWRHFRLLPAGQRFQIHNQEQNRLSRTKPAWQRYLQLAAIPVLLALGVLLTITPGPAFVFYGAAAALLASHSRWIARALDRTELFLRRKLNKRRNRRYHRHAHHA